MPKICVLGLGYIGLPTASMFATNGYDVLGVDVDPAVVSTINKGRVHIEEPGLRTIVQAAIGSGNLRASGEPEEADVFIIAVPTPFRDGHHPDLSFVEAAARAIAPHVRAGNVVILESTSPPGTTAGLVAAILADAGLRVAEDVFLAHCPERVLPGRILEELIANDRIIGGVNLESAERAADLYRSFVTGELYLTDATTAETVKLVENIYRDVNIALANELALICEKLGIDAWEVIELANKHPRVQLHQPGPGVGGHCIAVDPWFLVAEAPAQAKLIRLARERNDHMPAHVLASIKRQLHGVPNPKIAVLGVAYKGNVDDTRESPAIEIIAGLHRPGFLVGDGGPSVAIYDPHVKHFVYDLSGFEAALRGADLIVVLTNHHEFRYIDPDEVKKLVRTPRVLDTRNCLSAEKWQRSGFAVSRLGAGTGADHPGPALAAGGKRWASAPA